MPRGTPGRGGPGRRPAVQGWSNRPEAVEHRQLHRREDGGVDDDLNREEGEHINTRGGRWQGRQAQVEEGDISVTMQAHDAFKVANLIKQNMNETGDDSLQPLLRTLGQEIQSHLHGEYEEEEQPRRGRGKGNIR